MASQVAQNPGLIPGLVRLPREGNGNHCSCLENSRDRETWWAQAAQRGQKTKTQQKSSKVL